MIGLVFSSPKGRENLDDIVIEPKLPKAKSGSWWVNAAREGFGKVAEQLFADRMPASKDVDPTRRPSNWDAQ